MIIGFIKKYIIYIIYTHINNLAFNNIRCFISTFHAI